MERALALISGQRTSPITRNMQTNCGASDQESHFGDNSSGDGGGHAEVLRLTLSGPVTQGVQRIVRKMRNALVQNTHYLNEDRRECWDFIKEVTVKYAGDSTIWNFVVPHVFL
uniref:Rab-GAP TBC domain-containing protein n=1 Tax=Steinernema glaseri TaxID=37863 RepID=A0A1I8AU40_9BILA